MSTYLNRHPILLAAGAAIALGCGTSSPAAGPEADGGHPEAAPNDSGSPDPTSDGAASTCPATYADVPQYMPCSGVSCSYFGQFDCLCMEGANNYPREWECISYNCICSAGDAGDAGDAGCVNEACTTDADCPSGQHCSQALGSMGKVCSVGCEGDAGAGGPTASCPAGAMCEAFAP